MWKQGFIGNVIQMCFDDNHDMTSHIAKAIVEELKKFLIHDSVDEMKRRLDKLFMVGRNFVNCLLCAK